MRLKIKLTVQKEVVNGAVLQQAAVVEFIIRNQQCKACEASFAQGNWHAIVQVRQRVPHKRTFFFLEQLILKHESHMECIKIETFRDGMDFYFQNKNQALRFIEFLNANVPTKSKYARKLVSGDKSDHTANFKHNFLIEIVPICKDDLLILPKELARNLSNISRLVLAKRIGSGIHVIDPLTGEHSEISTEKYWRQQFKAVMSSKQLVRYVVLNVEPVLTTVRPSAKVGKVRGGKAGGSVSRGRGASMDTESLFGGSMLGSVITDRKLRIAEVTVARESDLGVNDTQYVCISHLGNILREGDIVEGYDFTVTNWNIEEEDAEAVVNKPGFPDLVLVRKVQESKRQRKWKLRKLDAAEAKGSMTAAEQAAYDADYEQFMQDIESDRELRSKLNLYRRDDAKAKRADAMETVEEGGEQRGLDADEVRLDELLDDLAIEGDEPEPDEEDPDGQVRLGTIAEGDEEGANDPVAVPSPQPAFEFNPSGMKFV